VKQNRIQYRPERRGALGKIRSIWKDIIRMYLRKKLDLLD
jgi:hypothetical protein